MLQFSSPGTPSRSTDYFSCNSFGYAPAHSSPLASSSPPREPKSSPVSEAQARRQSQYKARMPSSPSISRTRAYKSQTRRVSLAGPSTVLVEDAPLPTEQEPRKVFLRERFRARCLERAQKDRERKIKGKRYAQELSSDGPDEDMDQDDEDDETIINDELFRRIIASTNRKRQYNYRVSYAEDVGSSYDPALEEIDSWEAELEAGQPDTEVPEDLDAEVEAYAAEYELHLEELDPAELFNMSDMSDVDEPALDDDGDSAASTQKQSTAAHANDDDVDMIL